MLFGGFGMKALALGILISTFVATGAFGQNNCIKKAVGKDGKPLTGAAYVSSVNKCREEVCARKRRDWQRMARSCPAQLKSGS
jgi:hypothetical protein